MILSMIVDVLPQSENFWDRLGAGYYDINRNTRLDFDGSPAEARYRAERVRGVPSQEPQGAVSEEGITMQIEMHQKNTQ